MHNIEIEELCVEAFSEIIVGDPMYLVNMETKKSTTRYIANFKKIPTQNRRCGIYYACEENAIDSSIKDNRILIYSVDCSPIGNMLLDLHKERKYLSRLVGELRPLKNDTKKINIMVNGLTGKILLPYTGSCWMICEYKKKLGYFVEIDIPTQEISNKEFYKIISRLFIEKENYEQMTIEDYM